MKQALSLYTAALVCFIAVSAAPAVAATGQQTAGQYKHIVDAEFVGQHATIPKKADVLIIDTAGRLHSKKNLMGELSKIRRVLERESGPLPEVLLVLDATAGQNGVAQARQFTETAGVTGIVLTKLDGTARGGIVVAIEEELDIPVKMIGVGEGMEDLIPFDSDEFVDALLADV